MKKCLIVLYSLGRGGAETVMYNYIKVLKSNKECEINILIHKYSLNGYEKELEELQIPIFKINSIKEVGMFKYISNLTHFIKNNKYNCVHIHMDGLNGFVAFSAKKAGIKNIICHSHSTGISKKVGRLILFVSKFLMNSSKCKFVACGEEAGKALFGKKKFLILKNGIDVSDYLIKPQDNFDLREELNLDSQSKIIIHIGRFDYAKNQQFIVNLVDDVVSQNETIFFVLVGNGECFESILKLKSTIKWQDHLILLGIRNDVNKLLLQSDLFIMPSLYEGLPVSFIEAQCAGLPCLLSSNITDEGNCNINIVKHIELNKILWVKEILENITFRKVDVLESTKIIKENGFDIRDNADKLLKLYKGRD